MIMELDPESYLEKMLGANVFNFTCIDYTQFFGEKFIKYNNLYQWMVTDTDKVGVYKAYVGGALTIRSTNGSNFVFMASDEETKIVLDQRWLEYLLTLLKLYDAKIQAFKNAKPDESKRISVICKGLVTSIVIETIVNDESRISKAHGLASLLKSYLEDFVEYQNKIDKTCNSESITLQTIKLIAPCAAALHELYHVEKEVRFEPDSDYDEVDGDMREILRLIENHAEDCEYWTILDASMQFPGISSLDCLRQGVPNRQTWDELFADTGMYRTLIDLVHLLPLNLAPNLCDAVTIRSWYCRILILLSELTCKLSEIKFLAKYEGGVQGYDFSEFVENKLLPFQFETIARRRFSCFAIVHYALKNWGADYKSDDAKVEFQNEICDFSKNVNGILMDLVNPAVHDILSSADGSHSAERTDNILRTTGYTTV